MLICRHDFAVVIAAVMGRSLDDFALAPDSMEAWSRRKGTKHARTGY
jgi:hypothetical protein